MLALVLVTWGIAFLADYKEVYSKGKPMVKWACAALLAIGVAVQALHELGVPVPGPTEPLAHFIRDILNLR